MKRFLVPTLVLLGSALVTACGSSESPAPRAAGKPATAPHNVIPAPRAIIANGTGTMMVAGGTDVVYSGGDPARQTALYFIELMQQQRELGLASPREGKARNGAINFVLAA